MDPNTELRLVIAGTRSFMEGGLFSHTERAEAVHDVITDCYDPDQIATVISGGASGGDAAGEAWAAINDIPIEVYHVTDGYREGSKRARWNTLRAQYDASIDIDPVASFADDSPKGPVDRNAEMIADADAFLALYDGQSSGTGSAIAIARGEHSNYDVEGLPSKHVHVHEYR